MGLPLIEASADPPGAIQVSQRRGLTLAESSLYNA